MQPVCDDFFEGASPTRASPEWTPSVRAYMAAVRRHLLELHDGGADSGRVIREHADFVDRLVRKLFRLAEDRFFRLNPRLDYRVAIAAVGGYGRRELSLASDIDLLCLYRGKLNPYVETIAESIAHRLWDAHLQVGIATRTVADCLRVGGEDLPTLTSFLDARFLIGDAALFAELQREVRELLREEPGAFLEAKLDEERRRHERYGESLYLLQPNVRESVGGLRDYHTARWLAQAVHPEVGSVADLRLHGFIDDGELADLLRALDFLWRVRNELHRGGRKDDRLHYAAQEALAQKFGLKGTERLLPVEELMRDYYLHARAIHRVSRRAIAHARELEARRRNVRAEPSRPLQDGFAVADGQLEIPHASLLRDRPLRLLSVFAVAQHHDLDLSVRAQRMLRDAAGQIDDAFRCNPEAAATFRGILNAPLRVYRTLRLMSELGILGAYLPEFARLEGMWQHDLYHTYTVDVHSLFLIEQLRRLRKGRFRAELPRATALVRELRQPDLVYLGCMLHDVGKGQGGGHSEKGARLVPQVCARLGLSEEETELVRFLVLHHLTMSAMAEQRNVHDPRVILRLANLVQTRTALRHLYLLTVADIRSVSAEAWTTWKAGLLEALYRNTAEWLEVGEGEETATRYFLARAAERVAEVEQTVVERLSECGVPPGRVRDLLDGMPRRYLLDHDPAELAQHVSAILGYLAGGQDVAVVPFDPPAGMREPFSGLVVLASDRPGLFATVTGVLAACGHDILGAQIYTAREGLAVDVYEVRPIPGGPEETAAECERIESRLREALADPERARERLRARRAREPVVRARVVEPAVTFANDESDFYTIIDVTAADRPGLLFDIAEVLAQAGLDVVMSRASTRASKVTDVFYVTWEGGKLEDPARLREIESALLAVIREGP